MILLRFDMRMCRGGAPERSALYATALEIAEWADRNGAILAVISEHHASPDGYLPSPLILASAMAARTERLPLQVAALLVPLHDPIALAEQMAVLDIVSAGRISYVAAVGYRREEYELFDQSFPGRGRRMEECLQVMRQAWSGEPFPYKGRQVQVTPTPFTPGGPALLMGGNSEVTVRRAARLGLGYVAQGGKPELAEIYARECEKQGTTPGLFINPGPEMVTAAFVSEDPERAWSEIGPYLLHDAQMYAAWLGAESAASKSVAQSVDALRAEQGAYRIFTPDEAVAYVRANGPLQLQPLCGGIPADLAWPSLELIASKVLPALASAS